MTAVDSGGMPDQQPSDPAAHPTSRGWRLLGSVVGVLKLGTVLAVLVVVYLEAPWDRRLDVSAVTRLVIWLVLLLLVVAWQIRGILTSTHPWQRAVEVTALSVAVLLLPFASSYAYLSQSTPGAFTQTVTRTDGIYFAVTVFSTVGFGDIAPVTQSARMLVTVQMLADLVLIGVIVRLVFGAAQLRRQALPREVGSASSGQSGRDQVRERGSSDDAVRQADDGPWPTTGE